MIRFLLHVLGVDDMNGRWYAFWSGSGGDASLATMAWASLRRHNCHYRWCPRIGRHPVPGKGWLLCAKHHQGPKPTAAAIAAATAPQED